MIFVPVVRQVMSYIIDFWQLTKYVSTSTPQRESCQLTDPLWYLMHSAKNSCMQCTTLDDA